MKVLVAGECLNCKHFKWYCSADCGECGKQYPGNEVYPHEVCREFEEDEE